MDHVGAGLPFLNQLRNKFRRVLQISIQVHHCLARRILHSGADTFGDAKAPRHVDDLDTLIFLSLLNQDGK